MSFGSTNIPAVTKLTHHHLEQFAAPSLKAEGSGVSGWTGSGVVSTEWRPLCNIKKTKDHYLLHVELPGIDTKNIRLSIEEGGVLCLSGERQVEGQLEEGAKLYRSERIFGTFNRTFVLPKNVDIGSITANFSRGLLEIRIPRTHHAPNIPAQEITAVQDVGPGIAIGHTRIGTNRLIPISEGLGEGTFAPPYQPTQLETPLRSEAAAPAPPGDTGTSGPSVMSVHEPKDPGLVYDIGGERVGPAELGYVQKVVPESEQVAKLSQEEAWQGPAWQGESLRKPAQKGLQKELGPEKDVIEPMVTENPEDRNASRESQI